MRHSAHRRHSRLVASYNSIDSRLPQVRSFKLDEFWKQILKAWADYPSDVLDKIFDTKRAVVKCIIDAKGENTYKLPHAKKGA